MRADVFSAELDLIENETIRETVADALENLPNYFFEVAASSTGRFHPPYALGRGGLVRHTKAAVKIADAITGLEYFRNRLTFEERDCVIAALILHDGWKHGLNNSPHTAKNHPAICADWFAERYADREFAPLIASLIRSHMGEWYTPKPDDELNFLVHLCDYLASRRWINIDFEGNDYSPDSRPDPVEPMLKQIRQLCIELAKSGVRGDAIRETLATNNDGVAKFSTIKTAEAAQAILDALEDLKPV